MFTLVENLSDHEDVVSAEGTTAEGEVSNERRSKPGDFTPEWGEDAVLCVGARGSLDDVAAVILAQLLQRRGIGAKSLTANDVLPERLSRLNTAGVRLALLSYMNEDLITHAKYLIRRLRRRAPTIKIMVGFWSLTSGKSAKRKVLDTTRADLVAVSLTDALDQITAVAATEIVETPDDTATA